MIDYNRQSTQPPDELTAVTVEEVDVSIQSIRRSPPTGGNRAAVGRDGDGVKLALVARPDGHADDAQQSPRREFPDANRLVMRGGHQKAVRGVHANPRDVGGVHPRLDAQDWLTRWLALCRCKLSERGG